MTDDPNPMAESGVTMHSDSEQYSGAEDLPSEGPSSTSSQGDDRPILLYRPPTLWSLVRGATINLFLPFVNGMMMGFGELFAHEFAFRLGWSGTRVGDGEGREKKREEKREKKRERERENDC